MAKTDGSAITRAMADGLAEADRLGLRMPYDIALTVKLALERAGYRIVREPRKKDVA